MLQYNTHASKKYYWWCDPHSYVMLEVLFLDIFGVYFLSKIYEDLLQLVWQKIKIKLISYDVFLKNMMTVKKSTW